MTLCSSALAFSCSHCLPTVGLPLFKCIPTHTRANANLRHWIVQARQHRHTNKVAHFLISWEFSFIYMCVYYVAQLHWFCVVLSLAALNENVHGCLCTFWWIELITSSPIHKTDIHFVWLWMQAPQMHACLHFTQIKRSWMRFFRSWIPLSMMIMW